ncbi:phospholipase D-like domain-containing protein [Zwartia vadi]|uniref:phospholipase D-like domain-containing protein n=1 Tax=Zwartia vadi TaxID=3058168 RepID=UPI0025B5FDD5|nr:phospholipase D-like domain-containing protein [Zwartia vadi]MDN3986814.1 phospholipase D-like domain-containing protein [Zwartia vadi]
MARLEEIALEYWPHILLVISIVASAVASVHAAMTKQDVRAAIAWVGVILFSPILGAFLYLVAGINRIRKDRVFARRAHTLYDQELIDKIIVDDVAGISGPQFASLKTLGDQISDFKVLGANQIKMLKGGDETYPAMLEAIRGAKRSIALQSYIFDHDTVGKELAQALIDAHHRGVQVRVLIDAVGAKYSHPPITALLRNGGVNTALFMQPVIGIRLVYANLRSHRKLLVIDGLHGFTGGMNIRESFVTAIAKAAVTHDTHFQVSGPVVYQLMTNFAHDWQFTTQEKLTGEEWFAPATTEVTPNGVALRCVPSGPDATLGSTHNMLLGALAIAQRHVRIQSPYLLPDMALIAALATTARRGVTVDIVVPGANNLKLVNAAMMAQIDQLISTGCRVWRASGTFDHSKLFTVDGGWSYIGSSNIDPRSLRLNFELDLEVYDPGIAQEIETKIDQIIAQAERITLRTVRRDPFWIRLRNKVVWLASPYL